MHFSTISILALLSATVSMASPIALDDAHTGPPTAYNAENDLVARAFEEFQDFQKRSIEARAVASQDQTYKDTILQHHNIHRSNHSAPGLVWNNTLGPYAQAKANTCKFDHSQAPGLTTVTGQNIALGTYIGPANISVAITDLFYNNEFQNYQRISKNFSIGNPNTNDQSDPFENWGHITQLVWGNTKSVACGTAKCNNGIGYFTACLYYPPGNYLGNFAQVKKPVGYPTVRGKYTNN